MSTSELLLAVTREYAGLNFHLLCCVYTRTWWLSVIFLALRWLGAILIRTLDSLGLALAESAGFIIGLGAIWVFGTSAQPSNGSSRRWVIATLLINLISISMAGDSLQNNTPYGIVLCWIGMACNLVLKTYANYDLMDLFIGMFITVMVCGMQIIILRYQLIIVTAVAIVVSAVGILSIFTIKNP